MLIKVSVAVSLRDGHVGVHKITEGMDFSQEV